MGKEEPIDDISIPQHVSNTSSLYIHSHHYQDWSTPMEWATFKNEYLVSSSVANVLL